MIVLPSGERVPAAPGKYRLTPPPDLNEVQEEFLLLEYDFPFLIVREMALPGESGMEQAEASYQACLWRKQHTEGFVHYDPGGYVFTSPANSRDGEGCCQLIPNISYIDETTWSQLSYEEKDKRFISCVPAVVIVLMTRMDKIEDLQAKVAKFINAGTHEGVIVDTRADRVWIYNRNQQPYFTALAPIEFDSWPGFTLDCIAIRDTRIQEGFE